MKFKKDSSWFWTVRTLKGFIYNKEQDRMILHLASGGIEEIPNWTKVYRVALGPDYIAHVKTEMEKESGQPIPMKTGA
jgi:hypothetical protein